MRILIFIALLCAAVQGRGQIYIDSYRFGAAAGGALLLDDYPNASAAYSVRKLRDTYTGNALRVRRVNGDTSSIGFASNFLDTAALKTFCGTASTDTCWVRDWFDQSGNAQNFTQTTNTNQPSILIAGQIVYKGNVVGIDFDGTNDFFAGTTTSNYITASTFSSFALLNVDTIVRSGASASTNDAVWMDNNAWVGLELRRNPNRMDAWNYDANYDINTININLNTKYIMYHAHYGGNIYAAINADAEISRASGNTGAITQTMRLGFGVNSVSNYFNGKMHEIVFYKTDQSANRSGINSNMNTFFSIY